MSLGCDGRTGVVAVLALVALVGISAGCQRERPASATVSGAVAYRGMGMEEVAVLAERAGDRAETVGETRSGYHGAFALRLPPGRYDLRARTRLVRTGRQPLELVGALEGVEVPPGARRIERLLLELHPAEGGAARP